MVRLAIKPQELVKIHGCLEKQKVGRSSRTQSLNMLGLVGDEKRRMKIFWYRSEPFLPLILSSMYMMKTTKDRADEGLKIWVFFCIPTISENVKLFFDCLFPDWSLAKGRPTIQRFFWNLLECSLLKRKQTLPGLKLCPGLSQQQWLNLYKSVTLWLATTFICQFSMLRIPGEWGLTNMQAR